MLPLPMVTVVIPSYNYANVVGRAIKSVRSQTLNNLELVIVDDGSTDNTEEAVTKAFEGDLRCHYIKKPNSGVADARNMGVFSGKGKYVCCLDADDQIAPKFLEYCVRYLEEHPEISIAYTGLHYVKPSGEEGLSPWPGEFDYDKALQRQNQIPTCNVSRRVVWERLGGQRQRYAPQGAGEEDAEMWLRAGAYGFRAKKISEDGLFIYSWLSGRVSGSKTHRITDYFAWHPWTQDGNHPFMSIATPKTFSHPVRQYDRPAISVIIPVGKGHANILQNALDSLEAQDFRNWECVLVWDTPEEIEPVKRAYPYLRVVQTGGGKGAGYARNRGVEAARAPLILFLDADDWLMPEALSRMFSVWEYEGQSIIYTDYIGKAFVSKEYANQLRLANRLLDHDEKSGLAAMSFLAKDYDPVMAANQPDRNLYIWNLVTSLIPKKFHFDIGGFDEAMKSWEDWDYYIRMAKAGKCFVRIAEKLVVYRFYSGERREAGLQDHKDLLQYLVDKYERIPVMGCSCKGKKVVQPTYPPAGAPQATAQPPQQTGFNQGGIEGMSDNDFVMIRYAHPNVGQHRVIGAATGIDYGYRGGGEQFLVNRRDIALQPGLFLMSEPHIEKTPEVVAAEVVSAPQSTPVETPAIARTPPPPTPIKTEVEKVYNPTAKDMEYFNFARIKGIGAPINKLLHAHGIHTLDEARKLTPEDLRKMSAKRASIVYDSLQAGLANTRQVA